MRIVGIVRFRLGSHGKKSRSVFSGFSEPAAPIATFRYPLEGSQLGRFFREGNRKPLK